MFLESIIKQIIKTNCELNIQVLNEKKMFLQFMNRKDPYHYGENTVCYFTIYEIDGLNIHASEWDKHGAWISTFVKQNLNMTVLPNLRFLEDKSILIQQHIKSLEFQLYLLELR